MKKRPPRSGYKPVPPTSKKGRKETANDIGPWAILVAIYRCHRGEQMKTVFEDLGVSYSTLRRWIDKWGGDVVHMRPALQTQEIAESLAAMQKAKKQMTSLVTQLERSLNNITGDENYWRERRDAFRHVKASKLPGRLKKQDGPVERPDFLKLSLD